MVPLLSCGSALVGGTGVSRKRGMVCCCCSRLLMSGPSFSSDTRRSLSAATSAFAGLSRPQFLCQQPATEPRCSHCSVNTALRKLSTRCLLSFVDTVLCSLQSQDTTASWRQHAELRHERVSST